MLSALDPTSPQEEEEALEQTIKGDENRQLKAEPEEGAVLGTFGGTVVVGKVTVVGSLLSEMGYSSCSWLLCTTLSIFSRSGGNRLKKQKKGETR